ncbi:MAG: MotA/TolQ/ExbB proton channel family protein [bacterium]|jgi:biopolymer transport protein ExbB
MEALVNVDQLLTQWELLVVRGGIMLWPLLFLSLLTVALIIERLLVLRRGRQLPEDALEALREAVETYPGRPSRLKPATDHPVGRILQHAISALPCTPSQFREALTDQARRERHRLERGFAVLELIVGIAPLLGLLGTALGMIDVFENLSLQGPERNEILSRGIAEALITTVFGLGVSIPALIAFTLLSRKVDSLTLRIEEEVLYVVSKLLPRAPEKR